MIHVQSPDCAFYSTNLHATRPLHYPNHKLSLALLPVQACNPALMYAKPSLLSPPPPAPTFCYSSRTTSALPPTLVQQLLNAHMVDKLAGNGFCQGAAECRTPQLQPWKVPIKKPAAASEGLLQAAFLETAHHCAWDRCAAHGNSLALHSACMVTY
jgi:hypothetical protein